MFRLNEICMVTHLSEFCGKDHLKRVLLGLGWKKVPDWDLPFFVHRKKCLFRSVYVDDMKMAGRKQNFATWTKRMKLVDLGEPTSLLDHVYLGCTQRECKSNESFI